MKRLIVVFGLGALFLVGCEPAVETKRPIVWRAPPLAVQSTGIAALKSKLESPGAHEAPMYGHIVSQQVVQNSKGTFDQYSLHSTANMMRVEAEVFAMLAKLGYRRSMVKETAGVFVVDYVHPHDLTIAAAFSETASRKGGEGIKSQVVFSWKIPG